MEQAKLNESSALKIVHLITTLDTGGAEVMLLRLLSRMNPDLFSNSVVSLIKPGVIGSRIHSFGIPVRHLGFSLGRISFSGLVKLYCFLRKIRPDILQTWMYHANILGSVTAVMSGIPVIWNIQASIRQIRGYKPLTLLLVALGSVLSRPTRAIVFNSMKGMLDHEKIGYRSRRNLFIPNGFDTDDYRPNPAIRDEVKKELSIPDNTLCVGLLARFHPVKDHRLFLEAAQIINQKGICAHFILCGDRVDCDNQELMKWIGELHLSSVVHLLGRREDMPSIMTAMDTIVSCSVSEGFSNVIGEAMACGVPCVVTDVGDSSLIVGETGRVISSRSPDALAQAVVDLLQSPEKRKALGDRARNRIKEHFSLDEVVKKYETLYLQVT